MLSCRNKTKKRRYKINHETVGSRISSWESNLYCINLCLTFDFVQLMTRLQSMAVFDEISGAEKPKIVSAGAQTSYQVRLISQPRCKKNINVLKTMKIRLWGQIEVKNL